MEQIALAKFKPPASREPILVTRFGQPIARIEPPAPPAKKIKFAVGIGTMTTHGDMVGPITDSSDWKAAQDPEENEDKV